VTWRRPERSRRSSAARLVVAQPTTIGSPFSHLASVPSGAARGIEPRLDPRLEALNSGKSPNCPGQLLSGMHVGFVVSEHAEPHEDRDNLGRNRPSGLVLDRGPAQPGPSPIDAGVAASTASSSEHMARSMVRMPPTVGGDLSRVAHDPRRKRHRDVTVSTRADGQRSTSTHESQRGARATQTRRPCQIRRCGKRAQSARGTIR
jgi:hypothetical protein